MATTIATLTQKTDGLPAFPMPYGEGGSAQSVRGCHGGMKASRTSGAPNFVCAPGPLHCDKIGSPTRRLRRLLRNP